MNNQNNKQNEILKLKKEIEDSQRMLEELEKNNFDLNGVWEFSTQGDCEGRSTRQLGSYSGNLFEGLKLFAGREYYNLEVNRLANFNSQNESNNKRSSVSFVIYDKAIKTHNKDDMIDKLLEHIPEGGSLAHSTYFGCIKYNW